MKKFTDIFIILTLACLIIGAIVSSCSDESDCSLDGRLLLNCTIDTIIDGQSRSHTLAALSITAVSTDSVIFNRGTNVRGVSLPLQYTVDTTALVLHYSAEERDTLIFKHTNVPYFISMECGYEMRQSIKEMKHTTHRLDSVSIVNFNTNANGTKNISLIYR